MDVPYRAFKEKTECYAYILEMTEKIFSETEEETAALANLSSLLMLELADLNWAGFYLMKNGGLVLGPFQGKPAVASIPVGAGVCGTAVAQNAIQLVEDVHACENHIACDLNSRSEIVVPVRCGEEIWGVLDIDSPVKARFDEEDREGLAAVGERLGAWLTERNAGGEAAEDADISDPAEQVVKRLKALNWHISFAESCTGGLAAGTLVNVASASEVFDGSFVTYANEAKSELLGVKPETIAEHGVVSEEVAAEMASGCAVQMNARVGVGITGVAGPTGGTARKPVGMVCFGFFIDGRMYTFTRQFGPAGRNRVRQASVDFVFGKLAELLP